MKIWIYISMLIVIFGNGKGQYADDDELNMTQLLNKKGYPMEIHEIETEDGYILDVYRIPYGRRKSVRRINRYPVILTHGLLGTAEMYIIMGPDKALAYMLADKGYDVWLINTRGSWHSRKHKTLNPDTNKEYWQFSFHEVGIYDLPATIDYILNKTNSHKVHYIGHSQGTTSFFIMCSERPEYNKRITVMVALAPSAILKNFRYPFLRVITPFHRFLENVIPLALSNIPAGGSVKQGLHYAQIIEAGKFQKYDWGPEKNMKKYNSKVPPEYKLENTMVPVVIFYGEADNIVTKEDVEILAQLLPNLVEMYKIPSKNWNHFDFIWGVSRHFLKRMIYESNEPSKSETTLQKCSEEKQ